MTYHVASAPVSVVVPEVEGAPAPTVGDEGESEVTVDFDTRANKTYFRADDILPVWAAAGAEVKVQGQDWMTLVKSSATTNTLTWKPTAQGVYTLSHTAFENETITLTTPVEVTTNDLEVTKPEEPKEPSVKLGVVAQRYPWDGKLDVQYWAKNTPNEGYLHKVTVTVDGEAKDQEVKALNGKNAMAFDMREAFGEVTATGVKVSAKVEQGEE